jgi:UDP-2,3-diacylglucosamine pyrophosphatase LpxH
VRTLVVSDLHLGGRLQSSVLRRPEPLARLLVSLADVDRLVLLGDVVELLERRGVNAMQTAEPVLRAVGRALGSDREVILVPGNHDHALVRGWARAHAGSLTADTAVPVQATAVLGHVCSWLAPARVSVRYPGVWLRSDVWATHGHYLDRHLVPVSAYGVARGLLGRPPRSVATPSDYELAGGPSLTSLEALLTRALPRPLAVLVEDLAELARAGTMPWHRVVLRPRLAPLTAALLGLQMRRASIPAVVRVARSLGVEARWVVFGHVHRRGPLPGERLVRWQGSGGSPDVANTGSWVYEPLLLHGGTPPHPYWPGGAVVIDGERDPESVGLLDELPVALIH